MTGPAANSAPGAQGRARIGGVACQGRPRDPPLTGQTRPTFGQAEARNARVARKAPILTPPATRQPRAHTPPQPRPAPRAARSRDRGPPRIPPVHRPRSGGRRTGRAGSGRRRPPQSGHRPHDGRHGPPDSRPPTPTAATPQAATTDDERRALIAEAHFGPKTPAASQAGMAICSHPLATREAVKILRDGGNACDAALAASVAQTVVEPHMTGITGVLSMLHYDAATGETTYVNGGANAPLAPLPGFSPADLATGRGPGVPGFWGGFEAALARHGSLPRRVGSWRARSASPGTASRRTRSCGARSSSCATRSGSPTPAAASSCPTATSRAPATSWSSPRRPTPWSALPKRAAITSTTAASRSSTAKLCRGPAASSPRRTSPATRPAGRSPRGAATGAIGSPDPRRPTTAARS